MFDGEPIFFRAPHEFRGWLERHHATATECVVGYWKTHTGKPSLRWADAVREALRFGWIDGQGRSIDDERHMQRFTPRKSRRWSAVNVALVAELEAEGLALDDDLIRDRMSGNLCRCGAYMNIVPAIREAAG